MRRRDFLRRALAGGAIVTMPAFLNACGVTQPALVAAPLPEDPFLDWFGIDRDILARVLTEMGASGADVGEVFLQHRRHSVLRIDRGALGSARTDILQGAGLRVLRDGSARFARTEAIDEAGLVTAARQVAAGSVPPDEQGTLTLVGQAHGDVYALAVPWSEIATAQKLPILERVDATVRAADATITNVTVTWADTDERILIATLDGQLIFDRRPMSRLSVQTSMSRDGITHSGFASIAGRVGLSSYSDERLDALVQQVVERTQILFDARRPPIGEMPVILAAGTSGVLLHEAVGHAFEADFVMSGKSPYRGAIGDSVADASITIVDQGTLPGERGALNVDDEGIRCRRNVLVEAGELKGFLHDRRTARANGAELTGSGRRESYRHEPMPRMTCTFMEDGAYERDELIAAMGRGVVAETFTGGAVELGNGDFEFAVRHGWLVEKGQLLMPIRDFKLVGNGPEMLRDITMLANDRQMDSGGWTCGKNGQTVPVSQGMPSVLVSRLSVAALS